MNKSELVNAMAEKAEMTKVNAKKALEAFVSVVENALVNGDKVNLTGFGSFSAIEKSARTGINPSTKNKIAIPAKKVVKFKAGLEFAEKVK